MSDGILSRNSAIPSFISAKYESQEMRRLLELNNVDVKDEVIPAGIITSKTLYKEANIFPSWLLTSPDWINTRIEATGNAISDILKVPANNRSQEQVSSLVTWLMSVWKTAYTMGFKRCASMLKEFKYVVHKPGDDIVKEGDRGQKFYIIISGSCNVHKQGIGIVGNLTFGKTFGEIALKEVNALRTATVTAATVVEILTLHKVNYDFFVRDLEELERRENFHLLSDCKLFKTWSKTKIEKMVNACRRRVCSPGEYIFHQGDEPDGFYIVVEGTVNIVKELEIVRVNRWPSGYKEWTERKHKIVRPVLLEVISLARWLSLKTSQELDPQ
eukprot:gene23769-30828_t